MATEGDQIPAVALDAHQPADVVADHHSVGAGCHQVVPRCARAAVAGEYRFVGVQLSPVGRVGDRTQNGSLPWGHVVEQQQRLVGMDRDDGRVEQPRRARARPQDHAVGHPLHRVHGRSDEHLVEPGGDGLDVVGRTPGYRAPGRRAEHRQHAVMFKKDEQVAGRIAQGVVARGGPDGCHQGRDEVVDEVRREAVSFEECIQGLLILVGSFSEVVMQQSQRGAVEADDFAEHPQVAGPQRLPAGKQSPDSQGSGIFESDVVGTHRH